MERDGDRGIILVVIVQKFNSVHFPLSEYKGCYKELCSKIRLKQLWFPRKLQRKTHDKLIRKFYSSIQNLLSFSLFLLTSKEIIRSCPFYKKKKSKQDVFL